MSKVYTITRKANSKPTSPMRVILAGDPDAGGGLAAGGSFYFQPGESHSGFDERTAAAFMADEFNAAHFDVDPALPKKVEKEAIKAEEARVEVPATDAPVADAAEAKGKAGARK